PKIRAKMCVPVPAVYLLALGKCHPPSPFRGTALLGARVLSDATRKRIPYGNSRGGEDTFFSADERVYPFARFVPGRGFAGLSGKAPYALETAGLAGALHQRQDGTADWLGQSRPGGHDAGQVGVNCTGLCTAWRGGFPQVVGGIATCGRCFESLA